MKIKFLLLILLFTSEFIHAQSFNAGIRFGIVGSQVNGDQLTGFNKAGFVAGGYVKRKFSDVISLQMEIVYIQKGSRKPTDMYNSYYLMRLGYIEVPLNVLFHVAKKVDLTAGPSFGTLIASEEKDEYGTYTNAEPFEKFELSYNFGLIYQLSDNWSFDGRYSHSLMTIRPFPGTSSTFFDKGQYNVVIEFSLLYGF